MTIFVIDPNNPLPTDPTISNFDPTKDFIQLPNPSADEVLTYFSYTDHYTLETVGSDTHILTTEGDLVAVIEGVTELKPFTGFTPDGAVYLVSLENEFFSNFIEPSFFEPWYLELQEDVPGLIASGQYTSAYDHYFRAGQFELREDTVFDGTAGNSTVYGTGYESGVVGVEISDAVYTRDVTPVTTGTGEVDILVGSPGENTFILGNGTIINDAPQSFYVGQGDADYALIKGFSTFSFTGAPEDPEAEGSADRLLLGGRFYDYIFNRVGQDLEISTRSGDLVAIVENAPAIDTPFNFPGQGATYLYFGGDLTSAVYSEPYFYEPFYLAENPGVAEAVERGEYESAFEHYVKVGQFNSEGEVAFGGTSGDDGIYGFGSNDLLFGVPLTSVDGDQETWTSATTGVGEVDILSGGLGITTYFIGNDRTEEIYYLGNGDEDYALIQNFDPYKDFIFATGEFEDYSFQKITVTTDIFGRLVTAENLQISYQSDLVAVIEDIGGSLTVDETTLQEFSFGDERPGAFAFVAPQNEFLLPPETDSPFTGEIYQIDPDATEPLVIDNFDRTQDVIQLANPSADEVLTYFSYTDYFTLETVGSDTQILTTEGDLVAVIEGITELKPFTGFTPDGSIYLVSLENEFFSTYIEPSFFEPWYLEQDVSDYGNSVQEAIDAGIVDSAYEHYLEIGQFEGREDAVFFGTEGNDILYGTGAEPVLIGVPITEAVYARDNVPVTTGEGELDTLVGSPGGDTFVLGNGTILNDVAQSYYVGGGEEDYALIKGLSGSSVTYPALGDYEDATIDRLFLAGKSYDYLFEKRENDLHVSTRNGDLIAIVEDAPIMETPFSIPGASYLYGIDNVNAFDALWGASSGFYDPFYFTLNPGVEEAVERGEYESAIDHYFKVGQFQENSEVIFHDANNEGFTVGYGPSDLLFGVSLTSVDGEQEAWTSTTTGVGEQDFFIGGAGVTTYFIGNDNILEPGKAPDVYYLGQGDEDYAFIQNFDPYKDFIFAVGEFGDYTFDTVDATWEDFGRVAPIKNLEISYQGDLVAVLSDVASSLTVPNLTLQEFSFGDERPDAFAFVAPQNEFLPEEPSTINPFTGQIYEVSLDLGKPLIIENFDPTQDAIELPSNPDSEVIQQFSFSDRYRITEVNGNSVISTLTGAILTVIEGVTGLKPFTSYTPDGSVYVVSLENSFFSTYIEPNFFEPWYLEFDASDYGNSVQQAIDAGLVASAYEHYLQFGQFEGREDSIFAATTDGNNTLYGSGYENGLVGVPISEGVYTRDVKPVTTGVGEIDTLIGAAGEDTFFLGNAAILNETPQPFYVGEGDNDYALIKNLDQGSTYGISLSEYYPELDPSIREALIDRVMIAGRPFDYTFEKVGDDLKISYQGDLIAWIEDAPPIDVTFSIAGGTYIYTTGNVATFDVNSGFGTADKLYEPFYFEENPEVEEAIVNGEYASAFEHYVKVGQFNPEGEVIFSGSSGDDFLAGFGNATLLFGVEVTFVDGEQEGYQTATTGVGERDFVVGGLGIDTYVIGNDNILDPAQGSEVWYLGNGDEDYLAINGFDPYKDFLFGAGNFEDYSFEVIEEVADIFGRLAPYKSLEVNYQGDRVALLKYIDGSLTLPDLTSLMAFPLGDERPNGLALVAPQNEFLPPPETDSPFTGEIYEINPDATEPLVIENFDITKDVISLAGAAVAYNIETVEGNLQISTAEGTLLATLTGVTELSPYKGFNPQGTSYLVSLENEFFSTYIEPYFFEPIYPVQNPDVDALIAAGQYTSYYDHFLNAGQFEQREDTFFAGTEDNDTLYSLGWETVLVGVPITQAQYQGGIDVVATDLGMGTVDTLYGGAGVEAIFVLGTSNIFNETAQSFYLGDGDEDYALIKDFTLGDRIFLGSDAAGFTREVVDGNVHIVKDGDLIAIVEGVTELEVREDDNKELVAADETALYASGTDGDDVIYPSGRQNNAIGVAIAETEAGQIVATSTGVGEFDILYDNPESAPQFFLGFPTVDSPDVPQALYVGNGDEDYALIKNFDPFIDRFVYLAGKFDDYEVEVVDGDTRISKDGDLIGVVEDATLIPEFANNGYTIMISSKNVALDGSLGPYFNETLYLENNPDAKAAVEAGEYESGLQHFREVGLLEDRYAFYTGTDGNDEGFGFGLWGVGNSYLIGVPVTGFDPETEQFTTESTGTGTIDKLSGLALTNKFILGNNGQSFYVGNGDEDYAIIGVDGYGGFDPLKDYIFLAGAYEDYTLETVTDAEEVESLKISLDGDLVAIVNSDDGTAPDLDPYTGFNPEGGFYLVSSELQPEPTSPFTGQIYEVSADLTEPLVIDNFDRTQDVISLVGAAAAYNIETVEGNLQISTAEGTLLATLTGVTELSPYEGFNPQGTSYLLSLENEFFSTYIEPYFFEPIYPVQNPDVDALIASGQYTSYYDHFLKAGQFEFREDTFLAATEGNDTLYSLGWETVLVGVPITQAQYRGGLDVVPTSLGTGTVDTLYGGAGKEAIFVLGTSNILNETAQSFYIGEGDEDYALIKNFKPGDRIFLGSDADGFTQEVVDGNTQISKEGDLIAILEGITELIVREDTSSYSGLELIAPPTAFYTPATDGDDTIFPEDREYNVIGVPLTMMEDGTVVATSMGVGEFDTLYDNKNGTVTFYLGFMTADSPDTPVPFYIGNGDADYALIKNFNPINDHPVNIAGEFEDYEIEIVDGNTRISKDGDLVAIVENVILVPDYKGDGFTNLYSADDVFFVNNSQPYFNETLYLENNPDAKAAVEAGEYESGFQHFMRVGFLEGRYAFYNGTSGDDAEVYATGNSYVLGVPATGFDPETEQFTTQTTGTGTVDLLSGTALVNKFILGSNSQSFYVGEGDADYATIGTFDPLKDYLFLAGAYEDYTFETVTDDEEVESLKISIDGDLVAIVNSDDGTAPELEVYKGETPDGGFYLVSPEYEDLPSEPPDPLFGTTGKDTLKVNSSNQLVFAGAGNDLIDAADSEGDNRIDGGSGEDTFILGSGDELLGKGGSDRFFVQTGGDNLLQGGAGADQFWIATAEIPEAANIIADFTAWQDVIGVAGLGASFSTLTLTQQQDNTLIAFNNNELAILNGIQASSLSADNFVFA